MKNIKYLLCILIVVLVSCSNPTDYSNQGNIFEKLTYYQPEGFNDSLLIGTYQVYENRVRKTGRKIPIYIAITPAIHRDNLMEPIFMIDGGPGLGVSEWSHFYTELDTNYRKFHDIVFIDVRGTGKSQALHCLDLQTKTGLEEHFGNPYPLEELQACIDNYRDSVDFNNYTTKYIVEDLEEIRSWLGYQKINLYGLSYGGKVALTYMHLFPASISRSVLHSPSIPYVNNHIKRASWSEKAMGFLFEYCREDSLCSITYPNIQKEFKMLANHIKSKKMEVIYGADASETITLNWETIAQKFYSMLYSDSDYIRLPYLIHQAYLKNYQPLLEEFHYQHTEPNLRYADGLFLSIICAEEIHLEEEDDPPASSTFLGDVVYRTRLKACETWPVQDISDDYKTPFTSDIPTLVISGKFDPVTPPETGKEISNRLTNSQHIIIPFMGHMFSELSNIACYDNYVVAFYENREKELDLSCFNEMKPKQFVTTTNTR